MRALLVIPDPHAASVLEAVLTRRGWNVEHAAELLEPFAAAGSEAIPLVVVQEDSAGTAADACRRLRQEGETTYVLVIVPQGDLGSIHRLIESGADDVINTPVQSFEVEARVAVAEARAGGPDPSGQEAMAMADELYEIHRQFHVQQAFLEGLFESAPEGVVILDAEDRVIRINSEFTRVFGYTFEDAYGRALNDLIVPDELHNEGLELDGGVRRGERVMVETLRRHKDGRLIDVSVLATPIDVNGPVGAFGIYRDITERKRQEAALMESEARYRALFDQSPVGVFLCDRDLRITHCNEYLTRMMGAPYEEIVGADLLNLRNSRLLPGLRAALGGEPAFYEGPYRALNGKQLHVSVQYAPLRDERGAIIGGIGVLDDISDRIAAEMQLRAQTAEMERVAAALRERTLELEAAMQSRSRLYSAMNHELRTPISAIMLYQELLLAGSLGPLGEEQMRALEHSHTATRHLLELVRDILDLSKIEAGKVTVQPTEVELRKLLAELHASMSPLTEHYGSSLHLELEGEPGRIITDPQRLRQILMNFVSNAAKYGRQKPIRIRCRRARSGEPIIEVIDCGIGIAEADLDHIFEDFVQLGLEREEGTGLGLAICRRLAELLGGRLEVESELGVGSTFRLVLPPGEEAHRASVGAA
jgi:PAS domain S-box-containing protein